MVKAILITCATDGIGLVTARTPAAEGHAQLLHGRSAEMLDAARSSVAAIPGAGPTQTYLADLSDFSASAALADAIAADQDRPDVLINTPGIFRTSAPVTAAGSAQGRETRLDDMEAYAQSKLAITMWSREIAARLGAGQRSPCAGDPRHHRDLVTRATFISTASSRLLTWDRSTDGHGLKAKPSCQRLPVPAG